MQFTDQLGRTLFFERIPTRIVSLVPSQTELLYDLGLDAEVVGQTLFCIHPEHQHKSKPRVGGTKKLKLDVIRQLQPDLIIGNKEENDQQQIETLMQEFPVWMSDIRDLDDALHMMERVGQLVGRTEAAGSLTATIRQQLMFPGQGKELLHAVYLIWRNPYMSVGTDTFISHMLPYAGMCNALEGSVHDSRYPELSPAQLAALDPDVILLSSEPFPFKESHVAELKMICPGARVVLVDGEMFSWYGSRLLKAATYFRELREALRV